MSWESAQRSKAHAVRDRPSKCGSEVLHEIRVRVGVDWIPDKNTFCSKCMRFYFTETRPDCSCMG
jgi:hypothetical protein